jgi:hypothetical protein
MVLQINPAQIALWRSPDHLQIGVGKTSVSIPDLSIAQQRLIALLYRGIADEALQESGRRAGLDTASQNHLLALIEPLLLRKSPSSKALPALSNDFVSTALAELSRASLINNADGEEVLILRSIRSVHVESLSKTGLMLVRGLVQSGVKTIISHDNHPVTNSDLGSLGYPLSYLGHSRFEAANKILSRSPTGARLISGVALAMEKLESIDCAVLIGHHAIEPRRYARWLNRRVPHLAITFGTDFTDVSALVAPGITPCLFCREIARTKADPQWPILASQLTATNQHFDDSVSQLFAVAISLEKILRQIDFAIGFEVRTPQDYSVTLNHDSSLVTQSSWDSDSQCECKSASRVQ